MPSAERDHPSDLADVLGLERPAASGLEEHQILYVEQWMLIAGCTTPKTSGPVTDDLVLHLKGQPTPSCKVTSAHLRFRPDGQALRVAGWDDKALRISLEMARSAYPAVMDLLQAGKQVYCQYRRYSNGHVWADLHRDWVVIT